jgi:drug/metabolite transporter superfamily protein YnfA
MTEPSEFEKAAASNQARGGLWRDLWGFLRENKKWWLLPIIVMLALFGLLVFLSGTGVAPFIYTLF